jgi:hypothetical protein
MKPAEIDSYAKSIPDLELEFGLRKTSKIYKRKIQNFITKMNNFWIQHIIDNDSSTNEERYIVSNLIEPTQKGLGNETIIIDV